MKLYIPTCSANISNILSTESISPDSVYERRKFGIRHFHSLGLFDNNNALVLFSKYPRYELHEEGVENYYMVISIETDDYPKDYFKQLPSIAGIGIYVCAKTIYLNPFNCFFYLPSAQAVVSARFHARQVIDSKFAQLYENNYNIKSGKTKTQGNDVSFDLEKLCGKITFQAENASEEEPYTISVMDLPEYESECDNDYQIDKIRGFIYCYVIGANSCYSKELAELYYLARMLRNKFSAIIHSPEGKPLPAQIPLIKQMIERFNDICDKIDEHKIKNIELVRNRIKSVLENSGKYLSEDSIENAKDILESFGYYQNFYQSTPGILDSFDASELWSCVNSMDPGEAYKRLIRKMEDNLQRLHKTELQHISKISLKDCFCMDSDGSITTIDPAFPNAKHFYSQMVNLLCKDTYKEVMEEAGVSEKKAIIYNGGVVLKEIIGEAADDKALMGVNYLRQLFSSLDENITFEIASHDSPILQSFAAFGLQHDDIFSLDSYLELCKIPDRRLAYGLLGARYGFASLPKTFTASLIDDVREYYKTVYFAFYKMIFNQILSSTEYPQRKERMENNAEIHVEKNIELPGEKEDKVEENIPTMGKKSANIKKKPSDNQTRHQERAQKKRETEDYNKENRHPRKTSKKKTTDEVVLKQTE